MEKYAWRAILKPGMKNEYKRRHDEIWPEMVEVLKKAGIKNYTIWLTDDELFGYYECEFGIEYAAKVQNESSTVKKWDEYMKLDARKIFLPTNSSRLNGMLVQRKRDFLKQRTTLVLAISSDAVYMLIMKKPFCYTNLLPKKAIMRQK